MLMLYQHQLIDDTLQTRVARLESIAIGFSQQHIALVEGPFARRCVRIVWIQVTIHASIIMDGSIGVVVTNSI